MGFKSIVCLGAFPDRLDHILSTISVSQKILAKNREMSILLLGKTDFMLSIHSKIDYKINLDQKII
jgi:hypothetical protein